MAPYVEFMGYTQPWYSVRGVEAQLLAEEGHITCFLRDGDRVFLTYSTTGRGNEPADGTLGLLDMTPYGRREAWEDDSGRLARGTAGRRAGRWARRADLLVLADRRGRRRDLGPDQQAGAAVDPPRRDPRARHRARATRDDMAATYTFDVFCTLDGYGSYDPSGDWGG